MDGDYRDHIDIASCRRRARPVGDRRQSAWGEGDRPKPRSAQQARHKQIRFAYGAASAPLRPVS